VGVADGLGSDISGGGLSRIASCKADKLYNQSRSLADTIGASVSTVSSMSTNSSCGGL